MLPTFYASKIDLWLAALIGAAVLGEAATVTALALSPVEGRWYLIACITALGIVFPIWVCTTTNYQLDERDLTVRSGPFTWRVPLDSISEVKPTHNPLSSPALSRVCPRFLAVLSFCGGEVCPIESPLLAVAEVGEGGDGFGVGAVPALAAAFQARRAGLAAGLGGA